MPSGIKNLKSIDDLANFLEAFVFLTKYRKNDHLNQETSKNYKCTLPLGSKAIINTNLHTHIYVLKNGF